MTNNNRNFNKNFNNKLSNKLTQSDYSKPQDLNHSSLDDYDFSNNAAFLSQFNNNNISPGNLYWQNNNVQQHGDVKTEMPTLNISSYSESKYNNNPNNTYKQNNTKDNSLNSNVYDFNGIYKRVTIEKNTDPVATVSPNLSSYNSVSDNIHVSDFSDTYKKAKDQRKKNILALNSGKLSADNKTNNNINSARNSLSAVENNKAQPNVYVDRLNLYHEKNKNFNNNINNYNQQINKSVSNYNEASDNGNNGNFSGNYQQPDNNISNPDENMYAQKGQYYNQPGSDYNELHNKRDANVYSKQQVEDIINSYAENTYKNKQSAADSSNYNISNNQGYGVAHDNQYWQIGQGAQNNNKKQNIYYDNKSNNNYNNRKSEYEIAGVKRQQGDSFTDNKQSSWIAKFISNNFPCKGDSMKQKILKIVFWILITTIFVVLGVLGKQVYTNYMTNKTNEQIQNMYEEDDTSESADGKTMLSSFKELFAANNEIKGWIKVDNSNINYPVMQTNNNDFYLSHDFYKVESKTGALFADYRCNVLNDRSDNVVIYGHNTKQKNFFSELGKYKKLDFVKQNPLIHFDTLYEKSEYKVIACFITSINASQDNGVLFDYHNKINFKDEAEFKDFYGNSLKRSYFVIDDDVKYGDELLTLSTCSNEFWDCRFVVVSRKLRDGESTNIDTSGYKINDNQYMPKVWHDVYD